MIYVASPYSSPLPELEAQRFDQVRHFVHSLLNQGYVPFSPILYCRPIAITMRLPQDAQYWLRFNMQFLRKAEGVFVLRLPGWDQSKGVQVELKQARILSIPVVHWVSDGAGGYNRVEVETQIPEKK